MKVRETYSSGYSDLISLLTAIVGPKNSMELARSFTVAEMADPDNTAPIIGRRAAKKLAAAVKLGSLFLKEDIGELISGPGVVFKLCTDMIVSDKEIFRVILLNARNRVIDMVDVYKGSASQINVRACEVFAPAVKRNAKAVIFVHNHPAGDPSPSPDDIGCTRNLVEAGKILDIDVLDHIIVTLGGYRSIKEMGFDF